MIYLIIILGVLIIILASVLVVLFRLNAREDGTGTTVDKEEVSKIHLAREEEPDPIEEQVKTLPKLKKCRTANIKALWHEGYITLDQYKYLYRKYNNKNPTSHCENDQSMQPKGRKDNKESHIDPRTYKIKKRETRRAIAQFTALREAAEEQQLERAKAKATLCFIVDLGEAVHDDNYKTIFIRVNGILLKPEEWAELMSAIPFTGGCTYNSMMLEREVTAPLGFLEDHKKDWYTLENWYDYFDFNDKDRAIIRKYSKVLIQN